MRRDILSGLQTVKKMVPSDPVVLIDESDVVKPEGKHFEALGIVRDGSESTRTKNVYKKGYHVMEACELTATKHPVSIFIRIHSSAEKDYKSVNTITFDASEWKEICFLYSFKYGELVLKEHEATRWLARLFCQLPARIMADMGKSNIRSLVISKIISAIFHFLWLMQKKICIIENRK